MQHDETRRRDDEAFPRELAVFGRRIGGTLLGGLAVIGLVLVLWSMDGHGPGATGHRPIMGPWLAEVPHPHPHR